MRGGNRKRIVENQRTKVSLNIPNDMLSRIDSFCFCSGVSRTSAILTFLFLGYQAYSKAHRLVSMDEIKVKDSVKRSTFNCGNRLR